MPATLTSPPAPAVAPLPRRLLVLATGGTIAGRAARADDAVGYTAGVVAGDALLAGLPVPPGCRVEVRQIAQIDSKDADPALWWALAQAVHAHAAQADAAGVVITHGTDTLEETATALDALLEVPIPVVLTGAMRPATALQPDGPQNLADALRVAAEPSAQGVLVAFAGSVWAGREVRKTHPWALEAFTAGDAGPVALLRQGVVQPLRPWPVCGGWAAALAGSAPDADGADLPWVAIVESHAGQRGAEVDALCAAGVQGLIVAATGNGTVHQRLQQALMRAQAQGVAVRVASRCIGGFRVPAQAASEPAGFTAAVPAIQALAMTPAQMRVALQLSLRLQGRGPTPTERDAAAPAR